MEEQSFEILERLRDRSTNLKSLLGIKLYLDEFNKAKNAFSQEQPLPPEFTEFEKLYEQQSKKYQRLQKKILKIAKTMEYADLVQIAYFSKKCEEMQAIDKDYVLVLREHLNPTGSLSFLNYNGQYVDQTARTADGGFKKAMDTEAARSLAENFKNGTLKHGQKYGDYTIMGVYKNGARISCGLYSADMILSILKQIRGSK